MLLLRTESRKKEAEISLEATKNGCTPIAKVVVLPRSPDEALVVDVAGGLNGCDVIKQADGVLVKTASRVGKVHPQKNGMEKFALTFAVPLYLKRNAAR